MNPSSLIVNVWLVAVCGRPLTTPELVVTYVVLTDDEDLAKEKIYAGYVDYDNTDYSLEFIEPTATVSL